MILVESVFEPNGAPLPGGKRSDRSWRCDSIVQRDPGEGALVFRRDLNPSPQPSPNGRGGRSSSRLIVEPNLIIFYLLSARQRSGGNVSQTSVPLGMTVCGEVTARNVVPSEVSTM